jgi:hypothetical protein
VFLAPFAAFAIGWFIGYIDDRYFMRRWP